MQYQYSYKIIIFKKTKENTYYLLFQIENEWSLFKYFIQDKQYNIHDIENKLIKELNFQSFEFVSGFKHNVRKNFIFEAELIKKTSIWLLLKLKNLKFKPIKKYKIHKWANLNIALKYLKFPSDCRALKKCGEFVNIPRLLN
jgi:hypothetical protein